MTNSKKRLEEILQKNGVFANYFEIDKRKERIKVLRKVLLKEFVHKNNLPTEKEIERAIPPRYFGLLFVPFIGAYGCRKHIAKAIRKLIEGDQSV